MARPKGVIQARDESRYWLPDGVRLKEPVDNPNYRKDTKLIFIDDVYGEFISDFKALQGANASTHPEAVMKRREATNLARYGNVNAGPASRKKAQDTMLKKYGVKNALQSPVFMNKVRETFEKNGTRRTSSDELELLEFIQSFGLNARKALFGGKDPFEVDIYIESLNLGIEYNGAYFHSEKFDRDSKYHLNKTESMEKYGKRLIQIFDFEWKERNAQVKSFLRSALGKNENIIYARKCQIQEISKHDAKEFLEKYHILGKCPFKAAYGLYFNGDLLQLITIGLHHRDSNKLVLNRFVGKENYTVIGGLSKLSKHAVKIHGKIITWVDRRISTGSNWEKCGWAKEDVLPPDYFYYDNRNHYCVSKQQRQKNVVNTPEGMTEREHALKDNLHRIWDCGKIRFTIG
jgi:hypothetical protein